MEFLTVKETAHLLRVSPITVRRYIASGRLAAERVGRGIRVRREAIEEFMRPVVSRAPPRRLYTSSRNPAKTAQYSEDELVEIWSPSDPKGSVWVPIELLDEYEDERSTEGQEFLGTIIGIGRSSKPTNIAEHKDDYIADAVLATSAKEDDLAPDQLLGKPFTMKDALWSVFGIGESDDPTDVSENKHEYLAEAYLSDKG